MSDDAPAKNPQEMTKEERMKAAQGDARREKCGELLESGQEEVFSRSEVERSVEEHSAGDKKET